MPDYERLDSEIKIVLHRFLSSLLLSSMVDDFDFFRPDYSLFLNEDHFRVLIELFFKPSRLNERLYRPFVPITWLACGDSFTS